MKLHHLLFGCSLLGAVIAYASGQYTPLYFTMAIFNPAMCISQTQFHDFILKESKKKQGEQS